MSDIQKEVLDRITGAIGKIGTSPPISVHPSRIVRPKVEGDSLQNRFHAYPHVIPVILCGESPSGSSEGRRPRVFQKVVVGANRVTLDISDFMSGTEIEFPQGLTPELPGSQVLRPVEKYGRYDVLRK